MQTTPPLIDVAELAATSPDSLLLVDCRFSLADPEQGHRDYLEAHIPGSVYASLDRDLSDLRHSHPGQGRHPLPSAADFSATLARWGWRPELTVVALDAASGAMAAARLWWMVRAIGASARVLDGGLAAWRAAGHPVASGESSRPPGAPVACRFDPAGMVGTEALRAALASGRSVLIDARAAERYRGDSEPLDPVAGHVPGARNRPLARNLTDASRWKDAAALADEFAQLVGAHAPTEVVHMCGSGVTACHNLLAMEQAGLHGSRLYAPSWSGWCADPANPVATGAG